MRDPSSDSTPPSAASFTPAFRRSSLSTGTFPDDRGSAYFPPLYTSLPNRTSPPAPVSPSSRRSGVSRTIRGVSKPMLTVDTATDVPLISHDSLQRHPILKGLTVHPVPRSALLLHSANGSLLENSRLVVRLFFSRQSLINRIRPFPGSYCPGFDG